MDVEALLRIATAAELLRRVSCPVTRIKVVTARSKPRLWLEPDFVRLRRTDVRDVVKVLKIHTQSSLADAVDLTRQRVGDILRDAERECRP